MTKCGFDPAEEMIHGLQVRDPYRWLEDRSLPETEAWLGDQGRRCEEYFAACQNLDTLRDRVSEYLDVEVVSQPARVAGRYFYRRQTQGQEQPGIYVRDISSAQERLLVDSSAMEPNVSAGIYRISPDGSLLAYDLKRGGGDRVSIHFVTTDAGDFLPDTIDVGYARGLVFKEDCRGFYYCQEPSGVEGEHQIRFHCFGGATLDQVIFRAVRTRDSRLVLTADSVHLGAIWVHGHPALADFWIARRSDPTDWSVVFANKRLPYAPFLKDGRIFVLTEENAPKGKLIELAHDGSELRTVVPEQNGAIRQVALIRDRLFINYLDNLIPSVRQWNLTGEDLGELDVPTDGTIRLEVQTNVESLFYTYESFTTSTVTFEYSLEAASSQLWHQRSAPPPTAPNFIEQVSFSSKDGTLIPMTLISVPSQSPGLRRPAVMTGYGGFGVSMTPQFSVLATILTRLGAVFALPNIRGGGDFGKQWHDAGRGPHRQTAYEDFIAGAEWLCEVGLTSPQQLAIFGGSNSGLLVGVVMTQRPDLFRAVLCIAPLLDMVRYERFNRTLKWREEFGTVDDEESFHALYAYSPYHQVDTSVGYPAALFVSGDQDDRCNPMHARKMTARLQENPAQNYPILLDYSADRGHSPVLPLSVRVEALAHRLAFLCRELKIPSVSGEFDEASRS